MGAPSTSGLAPAGHPYAAEIDAERIGWYEMAGLVRSLTPQECLEPGYYRDPDWTVRDVVAHLGTWLALAQVQFERISGGTYEGHAVDIDALNAMLLDGMAGQPWEVAWIQAQAARTRMLDEWFRLHEPSDEAAWWIRKGAAEHFAEHLGRLREWTAELIDRRSDEPGPDQPSAAQLRSSRSPSTL
jgi:Mycothiol maleylpyruvate isomerase N-terminal domain